MDKGLGGIKLGLVPISKFVFSHEDALRYKTLVEERLRQLGITFVNIDGITSDGMLFKREDLPAVIDHLRSQKVDAVFAPHCNFGTEDVAALLGREMKLPYLLWGPRDEAPLPDGSRLRDSQCGIFATSRVLSAMNVPFTYIPNCRMDDPIFNHDILQFIRVANVIKHFRGMRIGQLGQRVDFFWTCIVNEAELLEKFEIEISQVYITDVMAQMRKLLASRTPQLEELVKQMYAQVRFEMLNDDQVHAIAALKLVMGGFVDRYGLDGMAVQCFPALADEFGIYPCYAHSLLSDEGIPIVCETDLQGAISAVMLQSAALGETPPFFADLTVRHPEDDNAELLWHCGSFPISLMDEGVSPKVGSHFIMPSDDAGVGHWRIKGGDITVARFADDHGTYRLAFGEGEGTTGPQTVGTYIWFKTRDWLSWERKFIRGPYIHHVAGAHGKYAQALQEACRYIPGLEPDPVDPGGDALEEMWWR